MRIAGVLLRASFFMFHEHGWILVKAVVLTDFPSSTLISLHRHGGNLWILNSMETSSRLRSYSRHARVTAEMVNAIVIDGSLAGLPTGDQLVVVSVDNPGNEIM